MAEESEARLGCPARSRSRVTHTDPDVNHMTAVAVGQHHHRIEIEFEDLGNVFRQPGLHGARVGDAAIPS